MPGFDRSGPRGAGPMSGGGRGLCAGFETRGGGFGRGGGSFGLGRRQRNRAYWADAGAEPAEAADPREARRLLKAERNRLKAELARTEDRLRALGKTFDGE